MSCEQFFQNCGKKCDLHGKNISLFCCVPCSERHIFNQNKILTIVYFASLAGIFLPLIIFIVLCLSSFFVAGVAAETGNCTLYLLKNYTTCGYWPMVGEINIWYAMLGGTPTIILTLISTVIFVASTSFVYFTALEHRV